MSQTITVDRVKLMKAFALQGAALMSLMRREHITPDFLQKAFELNGTDKLESMIEDFSGDFDAYPERYKQLQPVLNELDQIKKNLANDPKKALETLLEEIEKVRDQKQGKSKTKFKFEKKPV